MKYRVMIDQSFEKESDARTLMDLAKQLSAKAVSLNEGKVNQEIAYCDIHKCMHDEIPTRPCEPIERIEIRNKEIKQIEI